MLRPAWGWTVRALHWPSLTRFGPNRTFAYIAARTLFYDDSVTSALDSGIRQVVVLGAGYDSRAWRLARPGVRFFEVDHPATQADKRLRAPAGGPMYVPIDLAVDALAEVLPAAGFKVDEPALFLAEGLTMYLPEEAVAALLATLADCGAAGSRLAADFGISRAAPRSPRRGVATSLYRAMFAAGGETFRFEPAPEDAPGLLATAGWTLSELVTRLALGQRYVTRSDLPTDAFNPRAFVVNALRA